MINREPFEIKEGIYYLCIKTVVMKESCAISYIRGHVYKSEKDMCITDEQGETNHMWVMDNTTDDVRLFFRPATSKEIKNMVKLNSRLDVDDEIQEVLVLGEFQNFLNELCKDVDDLDLKFVENVILEYLRKRKYYCE